MTVMKQRTQPFQLAQVDVPSHDRVDLASGAVDLASGAPVSERLGTIFSALSDPTRIEMFTDILRRGEVGCSEFDRRFPISKSTISYHTKILSAAGLIETRRDGRFFFYRPRIDQLKRELPQLARLLLELS